jgi:hypothetical protein
MLISVKKSILALGVIGLITISSSCGKKETDATEVTSIASDDNAADNSFADLKDAGDQAGITNTTKGYEKSKDSCVKVSVLSFDSIAKKIKLVVDFGTTDCVCKDSKTRRGKITIDYTGALGATGSEVVYTPEKYFVNSYGVSGIKSIKIIDKLTHSIKVENGKITKPDGGVITWKSDRVRKMVAGDDTPLFLLDDAYEIEGTSSGINSAGKTYAFATKTPLLKSLGCQWIKSGKLEIQREGKKDAIIDYGNGICDDKATLNVGTWTKEITAKKW